MTSLFRLFAMSLALLAFGAMAQTPPSAPVAPVQTQAAPAAAEECCKKVRYQEFEEEHEEGFTEICQEIQKQGGRCGHAGNCDDPLSQGGSSV